MEGIDFRTVALRGLELLLFVAALVFLLPDAAAVADYPNGFMPAGAYAITCFAFSRLIAWRRTKENPFPILLEIAAFAVFARLNYVAFAGLG